MAFDQYAILTCFFPLLFPIRAHDVPLLYERKKEILPSFLSLVLGRSAFRRLLTYIYNDVAKFIFSKSDAKRNFSRKYQF